MNDSKFKRKSSNLLIFSGVGFIALATILYEICLTRIFAVTLWYYFGFLAISLAMLGTAASAVFCFLYSEKFSKEDFAGRSLALSALFFSLLSPFAVFIHLYMNFEKFFINHLQFYLILGLQLFFFFCVFFCGGMCISLAFMRYKEEIGKLYFFDLVGAGAGSVLVVLLLYHFSPMAIIFLISVLATGAGWIFSLRSNTPRLKILLKWLFFINLILFLGNDRWGILQIVAVKNYGQRSFQRPERQKVFEQWSPVSRIAVFSPQYWERQNRKIEYMRVGIDESASTWLIRFDGDFSKITDMINTIPGEQIVQLLKPHADVLSIGVGGGRDVLWGLLLNQKSITAVEVDPTIVELVKGRYADYIGRIFDHPKVHLYLQEGRNFVASSRNQYDIIQNNRIYSFAGGAAAAGAYIFNENNLYTKEAIRDYVSHLKPDGMLSMTLYYTWDETLRLTNMAVQYLKEAGIPDVPKRILVLLNQSAGDQQFATVLLKNGLFTVEEINILEKYAKEGKFSFVYAPQFSAPASSELAGDPNPDRNSSGIEMDPSEYADLFRKLILGDPSGNKTSTDAIHSYPKDISPSTDDWPFFFFTTRFKDIFHLDMEEQVARRFALPILYGTAFFVNLFSVLVIVLPLYWKKGQQFNKDPLKITALGYFAAIGMGYMLIELSLIQRLTVFLGHPIYSFTVVLSSLLCSSGVGSLVSYRWSTADNNRKLLLILGGVISLGALIVLFIYDQFIGWMGLNKLSRILMAIGTIIPIGFLMGMCLPIGMRIIGTIEERLIPWSWGINGAFSVLGSTLSLILALTWGLKVTFLSGVMCYLLAMRIIIGLKNQLKI